MGQVYRFGAFQVDAVRRMLVREGAPVPITPKAFSILLLLIERRGEVVTKEELIQGAWSGTRVSDANLMQNVSSLRKALGERAGDSRTILTIPGQGYRFAGELVEAEEEPKPGEPPAAAAPPAPPAPPGNPGPIAAAPAAPAASAAPRLPRLPGFQGLSGGQRRILFLVLLGAVLFLLGAGVLAVWRQEDRARLPQAEAEPMASDRPGIALGLADLPPSQARAAQALVPATPDAARLYAQGLERLRAFDHPGALDLLREASRRDPGSALIRSALAQAWVDLGEDERAVAEAREALRLAGSLPRQERLAVEGRLHAAKREWSRAADLYRSLWTFYPDNLEYGLQLAACLTAAGSGEEASAVVAALRRLPRPVSDDPRIDLAEARLAKRIADPLREKLLAERATAKGRRSGERLIVAQGLLLQGDALLLLARPAEALTAVDQARELFAEAGHHLAVAMALAHRGVALHEMSDLEGAERAYSEALAIAERLGSAQWTASQKANLGLLWQSRGDLPRAQALLEEAHALYARTGDRVLEARASFSLGEVLRVQGEMAAAQERFEQALALARQTGNRTDEARAASRLGTVLAERGRLREARQLHEEAFARLRQMGDGSRAASALAESARVLGALGELPLARRRLERALEAKRRSGDRIGTAEVLDARAELAGLQGDLDALRKTAGEQLRIARETGVPAAGAKAARRLGLAALAAGDLEAARRSFASALETALGAREELTALEVRLDLAHLELVEGRPGEAARLARAAAVWTGGRDLPTAEARVFALLAEALAGQGDLAGAEKAALRARDALARTEDAGLRAATAPHLARAGTARGEGAAALRDLRRELQQAQGLGFAAAVLEARLALGEILIRRGDPAGPPTLRELRRDATARGFGLLARRAVR